MLTNRMRDSSSRPSARLSVRMCFLKHFDRRCQATETIRFTIDMSNREGWRAESLPFQVMAPMAETQEYRSRRRPARLAEGARCLALPCPALLCLRLSSSS